MSEGARWYVVHTQPQNELRAELNLRRQGFATHLRSRRHSRRTEAVARTLFPRYLFAALDVARDRWRAVQSTLGISHIVLAGDRPAPLPEGLVEEIRSRENESGVAVLGLPASIKPGSQVRLIDGAFADYRGIIERVAGDRRVAVLLERLGREVRVFAPAASVGAS